MNLINWAILFLSIFLFGIVDGWLYASIKKNRKYKLFVPCAGYFLYLKKIVNKKQKKNPYIFTNEGVDYVIQRFIFKPEILEHTFSGDQFIGMDYYNEFGTPKLIERCKELADSDGKFMPVIIKELEDIIGDNECYQGLSFKADHITHIFYIKASGYYQTLEKIKHWCNYNEYQDIVSWKEYDINSELVKNKSNG